MKTKEVSQSLQDYVISEWGSETAIQLDDVDFNSDQYNEFIQFTVKCGPSRHAGMVGCYRVFGLVMVTVYVRPGLGAIRLKELTDLALMMLVAKSVAPVSPLVAPVVQLKEPEVFDDLRAEKGWVKAQVSCPFHYHVEIP